MVYTSHDIRGKKEYKVGDLIECSSAHDMIITDHKLLKAGYDTEYVYKINNVDGYWLEIRRVDDGKTDAVR